MDKVKIMKQFKISVVLAMATSFAFYATSAFALDKVHLQTDWIPSGEHAMYFGGWEKGFWKDEGIDI